MADNEPEGDQTEQYEEIPIGMECIQRIFPSKWNCEHRERYCTEDEEASPRESAANHRYQQADPACMEDAIDAHLEERLPRTISPHLGKRQSARPENSMLVVKRKEIGEPQFAAQVWPIEKIRLGVPLIPERNGAAVAPNQPELDPEDAERGRKDQRGAPRPRRSHRHWASGLCAVHPRSLGGLEPRSSLRSSRDRVPSVPRGAARQSGQWRERRGSNPRPSA